MPQFPYFIGGKVIIIDTENQFRPNRLIEIADRFSLDAGEVLENVDYSRAYTSEHQAEMLGTFHFYFFLFEFNFLFLFFF